MLLVHIAKLFSIESLIIYTLTRNINLTPVSSALSILLFFKYVLLCCLKNDVMNWYYLDYHWTSTYSHISAVHIYSFIIFFVQALFSVFKKFGFLYLSFLYSIVMVIYQSWKSKFFKDINPSYNNEEIVIKILDGS